MKPKNLLTLVAISIPFNLNACVPSDALDESIEIRATALATLRLSLSDELQRHHVAVAEMQNLDEVAEEERAHRHQIDDHLAVMAHVISEVEDCEDASGGAYDASLATSGQQEFAEDCELHEEAALARGELEDVKATEGEHEDAMELQINDMANIHGQMMDADHMCHPSHSDDQHMGASDHR